MLGRWREAARAPRRAGDTLSEVLNLVGSGCAALFGDGTIEFRAGRWVSVDSGGTTDLGPVTSCAGANNMVYVLPQQGFRLVTLRLAAGNHVSVVNPPLPCGMMRTTNGGGRAASRASAASTSATTATGPLLTVEDNATGYQCANGKKPIVLGCDGSATTSPCNVVYTDRPMQNGFQRSETEPRRSLVALVNVCKAQKIAVDSEGNLVFVP